MKVLHVSAECYPAAKAGGLGDVVGALPKYQNAAGYPAAVVIPKYRTKWVKSQKFKPIFTGTYPMLNDFIPFSIEERQGKDLGFPLYVVNITGQFDRPGIYGDPTSGWYTDNNERFIHFQLAVLHWLDGMRKRPEVVHCHDYHTGLIPFFMQQGLLYKKLATIPTVFTIHNGEYHGDFDWKLSEILPGFHANARGLLEWEGRINPLATGIKTAWQITTVSPSYMEELATDSNGLEQLISGELSKSVGVLNGIDDQVWDPKIDPFIAEKFQKDIAAYKLANKKAIVARFNVDINLPMVTFIGRLAREKGADLLPDLFRKALYTDAKIAFVVLGTGEPVIHQALKALQFEFPGRFDVALEYNEGLAHQLYAGSDFLIMPSRVEPCGLNQMYAMRYGTIPIVRSIGGLKDTVVDLEESAAEGRGIRFNNFNLEESHHAVLRAGQIFQHKPVLNEIRKRIMQLDFSWNQSAENYLNIYKQLNAK
ncbi:MAG: glycogen synthase GlgA [Saprospiraceae bacterium]